MDPGLGWTLAGDGSWLGMDAGLGWTLAWDGPWPGMDPHLGWTLAWDGPSLGWILTWDGSSPGWTLTPCNPPSSSFFILSLLDEVNPLGSLSQTGSLAGWSLPLWYLCLPFSAEQASP